MSLPLNVLGAATSRVIDGAAAIQAGVQVSAAGYPAVSVRPIGHDRRRLGSICAATASTLLANVEKSRRGAMPRALDSARQILSVLASHVSHLRSDKPDFLFVARANLVVSAAGDRHRDRRP